MISEATDAADVLPVADAVPVGGADVESTVGVNAADEVGGADVGPADDGGAADVCGAAGDVGAACVVKGLVEDVEAGQEEGLTFAPARASSMKQYSSSGDPPGGASFLE